MPVFDYTAAVAPFLRNGYNCQSSQLKVGMVTVQGVVLSIDWDTSTGGGSYETVTGVVLFEADPQEHTVIGQLAPDLVSRLQVRNVDAPLLSAALSRRDATHAESS